MGLTTISQHWEHLLFTTGGKINVQRSHWYLMTWLWTKGIPCLATKAQAPGQLELTTGYHVTSGILPRIEPTTVFQMLGDTNTRLRFPNFAVKYPLPTH
jgi:hypothetical protein